MASVDHGGDFISSSHIPAGVAESATVTAALCVSIAAVCAVALGLIF